MNPAPPTDPDELYRWQERIAICEESGVSYERAVEIARAEAERQGTLLSYPVTEIGL